MNSAVNNENGIRIKSISSLPLQRLLQQKVKEYLRGDSSSLPIEIVEEILKSICYVLGINQLKDLDIYHFDNNLNQIYERQSIILKEKVERGKRLWISTKNTLPQIATQSMVMTIDSIGDFWEKYDIAYFAHQIPCDIDYQLCHPINESKLGVDYVIAYLENLTIENRMISKFSESVVDEILSCYCIDYNEQINNIYEPVSINLMGLTLLNARKKSLGINSFESKSIMDQLIVLEDEQIRIKLRQAAYFACKAMDITSKRDILYFIDVVKNIMPRILSTFDGADIEGVFITTERVEKMTK